MWQVETNDFSSYFPNGYIARISRGPSCSVSGVAATTCTISGLTNGVDYTVRVNATYSKGLSPKEYLGFPSPKVFGTPFLFVCCPYIPPRF
jgi:hypothetical protein